MSNVPHNITTHPQLGTIGVNFRVLFHSISVGASIFVRD